MRINKKIIGIILLVLTVTCIAVFASEGNPAVTLDYLIEVFKPQVLSEMSYKVVNVTAGDRFYGGEGCEFILRGGKGFVKASELGGLNDATSGDDLADGTPVPPNHLLIVPRDDLRGFVAETDVIIIAKGKYYIGK